MSVRSTAVKVIVVIIAIIIIVAFVAWLLSAVAVWLYDLALGWWLDPIINTVEQFGDWAYNTVYTVTDDIGTALGGVGGTVETNLASGIVNTVGNAANDFINWFVGLFYQAGQAFGTVP